MNAQNQELIKEAYAYGAAVAMLEVGFDEKVASAEAASMANAVAQPQNQNDLLKQAYLYGVTVALQERGLDEKTAEATALEWVNY